MIAAGTFDDILCIFCFGIAESIAISKAHQDGTNIGVAVIIVLAQIVIGAIIGVVCGLIAYLF